MGDYDNEKSSIILNMEEYKLLSVVTYDKYFEYQQEYYAHRQIYELFRELHKEFYSVSSQVYNFDFVRIVTSKIILKTFLDCITNESEKCKELNILVAYNFFFDKLYDSSKSITIPITKSSNIDSIKHQCEFINSIKDSCLYNEEFKKTSTKLESYYHIKFLLEASLDNTCEMEQTRNYMVIIPIINGEYMKGYMDINYRKPTPQVSSNSYQPITAQREYSTNRWNSEDNDDFNYYDYSYNNDYDYDDMNDY